MSGKNHRPNREGGRDKASRRRQGDENREADRARRDGQDNGVRVGGLDRGGRPER